MEAELSRRRISINRAFPKVSVRIDGETMLLSEEMGSTVFYKKDGEVRYSHHWSK